MISWGEFLKYSCLYMYKMSSQAIFSFCESVSICIYIYIFSKYIFIQILEGMDHVLYFLIFPKGS